MFHTYVASFFIWMLHMFCNIFFEVFSGAFTSVLDACFKCLFVFRRMLQMFHLDVSKVDRTLHMLQCDSLVTPASCSYWGVVHACEKRRNGAVRDGAGSWGGSAGSDTSSPYLTWVCSSRGRLEAGFRPNVMRTRALVLPKIFMWCEAPPLEKKSNK